MANRSPPTPFIIGSMTPSAALAAMAASTALPPRARIAAPACEATAWLVATMPYCVTTLERACVRSGDAARSGKLRRWTRQSLAEKHALAEELS